jgi:type VI secretion system protein ImpG
LQALGFAIGSEALAGLRLSLTHRMAARPEDEISDIQAQDNPAVWFAGCRTRDLPVHLVGPEADAIALYEQLFAHNVGVYFRFLDQFGDPVTVSAPELRLEQLGFGEKDGLLGNDERIFRGFDFLREYFIFPRKFLGFALTGLDKVLRRLTARSIDIVFVFNEANGRLAAAVRPDMFSLYTAPAVNLFEKTTDRIPVRSNQHEYHVVPDRSHYLDFEPHRLLEVYGYYPGQPDKVPVPPLYAASMDVAVSDQKLSYTVRRLPRKYSVEEKKYGKASDYTGTDMFLSLHEPAGVHDESSVAELSVRALCSNRHLTEHLPVGEGGADFRLLDDVMLDVVCVGAPTKPREPVISQQRGRSEIAYTGTVAWRLINMLSLNHLGLVQRGAGKDGESLREILAMFGDLADNATERKIRGVRNVTSAPIVRRISRPGGSAIARGIEVSVTLDDKAFEGSGAFLLGAVLDRFFMEYAGLNNFTQTVVRTVERGEIMRWPARIGMRHPL